MADSVLYFELLNSSNPRQPFYWRIRVRQNGEVLASSETYVRKEDARAAIDLVYREAGNATLRDLTS